MFFKRTCTVDTINFFFFFLAKDLVKRPSHRRMNSVDDKLEYYSVLVCNMEPMVVRMDEK